MTETTKEKFEKPDAEVVTFGTEDVIVTSGTCSGECNTVCKGNCYSVVS